jgi:hypothetical protein
MASESDLAASLARADQGIGVENIAFMVAGLAVTKIFEGGSRNHFGLVESAMRLFARMQGHGHYGDRPGGKRRIESGDGVREQTAQYGGGGANLVEFEEMDEIAERAVIASVGYCSLEWRMLMLTDPATDVGSVDAAGSLQTGHSPRGAEVLSADVASAGFQGREGLEAILANWEAGNFKQWGSTDTAIGGKKRKEEASGGSLCPASDEGDRGFGLGSPYSKPGTAEDGLPHPERRRCRTGRLMVSISAL